MIPINPAPFTLWTAKLSFFTVVSINRKTGKESLPRYDLAPMNHAAACNFMDSCHNKFTDYKIHTWPDNVPFGKMPIFATGYRRDKKKT